MNNTDFRTVDKIVGAILIVLSSCGCLCGSVLAGAGALIGTAGVASVPRNEAAPVALVAGGVAVVGIFMAAIYALNVFGGVGVLQSKRWGFMLSAILTGVNFMLSLSGAAGWIDTLPTLAIAVYCTLRLLGKIGDPPL